MKILLVMQFFTPEPHLKGLPFARELVNRGHQVEVLTGFPNYPGGKVYPGYRIRPFQRETIDGVVVNRVPLYPSHSTSAIGRVLNYLSFALSASLIGPFVTGRPDVAYVYHPPATIGVPALFMGALKGVRFVYDVQDLWPDTLGATGMLSNPRILRVMGAWCSFVYRRASRIAVLSPGFKRKLVERGVPAGKVTVIRNWSNEDGSCPGRPDEAAARAHGFAGRFNILFAGTMGKGQDLDSVLAAADICAARNPAIQFVFVGGGVERSRLQAKAEGKPNLRFLPFRPPSEMPALLALADVLLVHLKNDPLFEITIPSKTQTYLAAGKPILMAVAGDAADMVLAARAGVLSPPGNPGELANAALHLASLGPARLREMGEAGRAYYERELSLANGVARFEELFEAAR